MSTTIISRLVASATSVVSTIRLAVGWKQTASGKETRVYASFRLAGAFDSLENVCKRLDALKDATVNVSVPALEGGNFQIRMKPTYSAAALAAFIRTEYLKEEAPAPEGKKTKTKKTEAPAPAPEGNGQSV